MGIETSKEALTANKELAVIERPRSSVEGFVVPVENLENRFEQNTSFQQDWPKKEETIGDIIKIEEDPVLDADCEEKGHDHGVWSRLKWRIAGVLLVVAGGVLLLIPGIGGGALIAVPATALVVTGNVCLFKKKFGKMWSWTKRKFVNLFKKDKQPREKTA